MVPVMRKNVMKGFDDGISCLDYIVPPQENNALFLMTNFIRTDQEHKRCPGNDSNDCLRKESFLFIQNLPMKKCQFVLMMLIVKTIEIFSKYVYSHSVQ